jgi:hypothetical protein
LKTLVIALSPDRDFLQVLALGGWMVKSGMRQQLFDRLLSATCFGGCVAYA